MKKLLIFGGGGFVGKHMSNYERSNYSIFSFSKSDVNITNFFQVQEIINSVIPDLVINFASITTIKESFQNPRLTYEISLNGTLNILEALKNIRFKGKFLNISSSEVYGFPKSIDLPLNENSPLMPMSPYSVAKISTEVLCNQWVRSENFDIITVRPFTHIGIDQSDRFSVSNFCKQIAEIELGFIKPVIKVGDLSTTRDFTNVKDIVEAYYTLLEKGESGEIYNVCSNSEISMNKVLNKIIAYSEKRIEVIIENSKLRTNQQNRLIGDYSKLRNRTGWQPKIKLDETIEEMIYYWKTIISR